MPAQYGLVDNRPAKTLRWLYLPFMLLLGLGSMVLATQRIAAFWQYQPALGDPWFFAFGLPWYAPWSAFFWQSRFAAHDALGGMEQAITHSQMLFLFPQFVILGVWLCFMKKLRSNANLHGSARWATEPEIRRMGYLEGKGVYVGGWVKDKSQLYLRHNGPEHIMVFAPTRSGKGVGLILPTLLAWEGSAIVLDIKGENWALTSGWRKSIGHTVLRFDPSDASGASARFNPLEELRLGSLLAIPDAQNMAAMLVDPAGKGLEDHWSKAAFAMLGGVLLHCCVMIRHKEGRAANLYDLSRMLADESRDIDDLFEEMVTTEHAALLKELYPHSEGGAETHIFIATSAREMLNKEEKESSGVVSTALANLALYRDPVVALNTASCDFRIHDLMHHENPVNLYLVISPADINRMRPLLRLMADMIIRRVCAKMEFADGASKASYKHRLLFMLDEFTSLGKLAVMENALAYIAGYGGKVYLIVQDITQLNEKYGKENALMANCHVRIAYAPNTIETARTLSDMTGKTTVVEEKVSLSGSRSGHMKSASVSVSETARPLLTPDECMRLPGPEKDAQGRVIKPGDMLIFTAGQSPIYGRQILYFFDPVFSARAKISAPDQSDSLYAPRKAASPAPEIPQEKENYERYFQK
ncbi:conjugal transfer protein TraG [Deltaproteobacteria bacterium]|nr:conjugal transfer protein TraG [Deltaproteobacteria bacterium]